MKVRFLRLSYFIWIIVPVALFVATAMFGLPHLRWSYDFRDDGQGFDPFAARYYLRCTFVGPYGEFTNYPNDGRCKWFEFRKTPEAS